MGAWIIETIIGDYIGTTIGISSPFPTKHQGPIVKSNPRSLLLAGAGLTAPCPRRSQGSSWSEARKGWGVKGFRFRALGLGFRVIRLTVSGLGFRLGTETAGR